MGAVPAEAALAGALAAETAVETAEEMAAEATEEARETEGWEAEATVEEMAEVSVAAMEAATAECADHTSTRCTGGSAP